MVLTLRSGVGVVTYPGLDHVHELSQADLRTVFSNAELIWNCNREFLSDLSKRFPWTPSSCIGDVMLRFIPFFKLYKEYGAKCASRAISLLTDRSRSRSYDTALSHSNMLLETNRAYALASTVSLFPWGNAWIAWVVSLTSVTRLRSHMPTSASRPSGSTLRRCSSCQCSACLATLSCCR